MDFRWIGGGFGMDLGWILGVSGWIWGGSGVDIEWILGSKIYRKSIEHLLKICRKSIEHLSKIYRKSIEHLSTHPSNIQRISTENPPEVHQHPPGIPQHLQGIIEHLSPPSFFHPVPHSYPHLRGYLITGSARGTGHILY